MTKRIATGISQPPRKLCNKKQAMIGKYMKDELRKTDELVNLLRSRCKSIDNFGVEDHAKDTYIRIGPQLDSR